MATPSDLDECEARSPITDLEWFLDTFHRLPSVVEDNHQWQHFAETIRQRLFSSPTIEHNLVPTFPVAAGPLGPCGSTSACSH